ncbi:hypothetical protein Pmani_026061 [Petrolisthes manimaculis]|uniref:COMM domain-containing protein 3 n=1 Tax=Petrolisthes manimaculis TaxID=1843537 RepID=A0AAE1P6W4_9EUCA|nr:hypothetical protein Pmani_026061 [Petrolisthes manimaculis]
MELSPEVSSALRLLGDASKTDNSTYQAVLSAVSADIGAGDGQEVSQPQPPTSGVVSYCHAALTTLFLESVRGGHSTSVVTSTLEDFMWPPDRVNEAIKKLDSHWSVTQTRLSSLGAFPPHIVDVDWQLKYEVRSSGGEVDKARGAVYLVRLHLDGSANSPLTFTCSLAQLTHMVTRLKQATRAVQKYANN